MGLPYLLQLFAKLQDIGEILLVVLWEYPADIIRGKVSHRFLNDVRFMASMTIVPGTLTI